MKPEALPPPPAGAVPRATWRAIEAIPIYLLSLLAGIVVATFASVALGRTGTEIATSAALELSLAAGVLLWIRALHAPAMVALGPPARPLREALRGVAGGVLTRVVAVVTVQQIVLWFTRVSDEPPRIPDQVPTDVDVVPTVLLGLVVVLLAPVGEELFFRGFLFRAIRDRRGFWAGALVSSAAFGAVHYADGSWFFAPVMFVVGMCFAAIYERERRILSPIVAHLTFNLVGYLVLVFG